MICFRRQKLFTLKQYTKTYNDILRFDLNYVWINFTLPNDPLKLSNKKLTTTCLLAQPVTLQNTQMVL